MSSLIIGCFVTGKIKTGDNIYLQNNYYKMV